MALIIFYFILCSNIAANMKSDAFPTTLSFQMNHLIPILIVFGNLRYVLSGLRMVVGAAFATKCKVY